MTQAPPRQRLGLALLASGLLVGVLSCAEGSTPSDPTGVEVEGTISGSVSLDGGPFAGVIVQLSGAASRSTETDATGAFRFDLVSGGTYLVEVTGHSGDVEFATNTKAAVLTESQPDAQLAFQASTRREATVAARVTVEGDAASGVTVALAGPETRTGVTDTEGNATFTLLPAGTYTVTIAGYDPSDFTFTSNTAVANAVNGATVDVVFTGEYTPHLPPSLTVFSAAATGPSTVELTWTDPAATHQTGAAVGASVNAPTSATTSTTGVTPEPPVALVADGEPTQYRVERRVGSGAWTLLVTLPAGTEGHTDTGLDPATTYSYRAQSCNEDGCSDFTVESITTTQAVPPTAPGDLAATATSPTSVGLTWTDNSSAETAFRIERRVGGSGAWVLLVQLPAETTVYPDPSASPNTEYSYRVQACSGAGCSAFSTEASVTTPGVPPAAPVALVAVATGTSSVDVTWVDIANNESEFRLERRVGGSGPWTLLVSLPADATTHSDSGLQATTTYNYRLQSCNAFGCSTFSNQASATTEANPPGTPSGLIANAAGSTTINLDWTDNSADETEFRVERRLGSGGSWVQVATRPPGSTSYSDTSLSPETEYQYRVRACNPASCSGYSNIATATTTALPGGPNLEISAAYLVQRTQRITGDVPLVKDLDAYARVFATANTVNALQPEVRIRFYLNGSLVQTDILPATSGSVPTSVDESSKVTSWNVTVPAALIQPGLSFLADVDPTNAIAESSEADNQYPVSGTPQSLDVRDTPPLEVTFVPVRQSVNDLVGNVHAGNVSSFMTDVRRLFPIADDDIAMHAEYTTDAPVLQSGNGNNAWSTILSEVNALRVGEGSSRNYYGVVATDYSSGVAGIGYIGWPTALGWDKLPSGSGVAAHEWGHNTGRKHSPGCGAGNPDTGYPYASGKIGQWGIDINTLVLKSPNTFYDFMTYCSPEWISDYVYEKILEFRGAAPGIAAPPAMGGWGSVGASAPLSTPPSRVLGAPEPTLLLWGRVQGGEVVLEPAFVVDAPAQLPTAPGPYALEGRDSSGALLFSLAFEAIPVADAEPGEGHFAFAVPLSSFDSDRLAEVHARAGGAVAATQRSGFAPAPGAAAAPVMIVAEPEFVPGPGGTVSVDWDAGVHPMVLVRDPDTGQILSFGRGGSATLAPRSDRVEIIFSDGVRSSEPIVRRWR